MAKYIRPTLDTQFHIDFSWWQQPGQNLRAELENHICLKCQQTTTENQNLFFDWISLDTGEVFQIDILWHTIRGHCQDLPEFLDSRVPLTSAIFRAFIANDNAPLTPREICTKIGKKSPDLILRTIGGHQVYRGIKPAPASS